MLSVNSIFSKLSFIIVGIFLTFFVVSAFAPKVSAVVNCDGLTGEERSKCEICRGSGGDSFSGGTCLGPGGEDPTEGVSDTIEQVINIFSWIVGVAAVIMIMIGGFRYVTSQGDSNNVSAAKNTILYAVIGLVVVALAQIIVRFVINKV
jgi:hypothetical protein